MDKKASFQNLYENTIEPLEKYCKKHGIPYFMAFGTSYTDNGNFTLSTTVNLPEDCGLSDRKEKIKNMVRIANDTEHRLKTGIEIETDEMVMNDDFKKPSWIPDYNDDEEDEE